MSLKENLNGALKDAMRSGAEVKKTTLRLLMAAIRQGELEQRMAAVKKLGGNPTDAQLKELESIALDDTTVLGLIQKEAKSRREAMADAEKAGRPDLVAANQAELAREAPLGLREPQTPAEEQELENTAHLAISAMINAAKAETAKPTRKPRQSGYFPKCHMNSAM